MSAKASLTSGYGRDHKRIWPTLLAAGAEAALRAALKKSGHPDRDVFTAVILSRTAFDAYLHEMLALRNLSVFVEFASGSSAKKQLSESRWRMIDRHRKSLADLPKKERTTFSDVRDLPLSEKLQTVLLLLKVEHKSPLVKQFERTFSLLLNLNTLRNAIIHHDFKAPSKNLKRACEEICTSLNLTLPVGAAPWEDFLRNPELAAWSCRTAANSLLAIEGIGYQRAIHLTATNDVVMSALSPLKL
ncbi:hypothetical protein ABIA00_004362 [Bradyrhizobium ottawaense]|uniref:hypothetical protein n=1 Tax=Bradyrhizobium ottawaense TaxID=931866 RepID=UPI0038347EB1